ncbi:MAG TPA: hypothetical protein PKC45_08840, partial [Gemmatales bacterium]|nr:hypothetical protein [Gemmatales bacterium]
MAWPLRLIALFGPAVLLLIAALLETEPVPPADAAEETAAAATSNRFPLLIGSAALAVAGGAMLGYFRTLAVPLGSTALVTHGLGLLWLLLMLPPLEQRAPDSIYHRFMESWLAVVAVSVLAQHWLVRTGAILFRRARLTSQEIGSKEDW